MFLTQGERGVIVFIERVIDAAVRGWGRGGPSRTAEGGVEWLKKWLYHDLLRVLLASVSKVNFRTLSFRNVPRVISRVAAYLGTIITIAFRYLL